MGDTTLTTSDGEEHEVFECDVCGTVPVLRLLDGHPEHDTIDDMWLSDDRMRDYYIQPEKMYNPLSFEETGLAGEKCKWVLCGVCRKWVEYMLEGALVNMFKEESYGE